MLSRNRTGQGRGRKLFQDKVLTSCNGDSILPGLHSRDPALAADVKWVPDNYSVRLDPEDVANKKTLCVEVTDGFRLLGQPAGSPAFADTFFTNKVAEVSAEIGVLAAKIPDLHTRMKIYAQCLANKLTYPPSGRQHHTQSYSA